MGRKIDDVRIERMDRIIIFNLPRETEFYTIFAKIPFLYEKACCIKRLPVTTKGLICVIYVVLVFLTQNKGERESC